MPHDEHTLNFLEYRVYVKKLRNMKFSTEKRRLKWVIKYDRRRRRFWLKTNFFLLLLCIFFIRRSSGYNNIKSSEKSLCPHVYSVYARSHRLRKFSPTVFNQKKNRHKNTVDGDHTCVIFSRAEKFHAGGFSLLVFLRTLTTQSRW